jgi:hypothetical protein
MSGRILDDATSSPVAGATITIESWHARAPIGGLDPNRQLLKTIDVRTDAEGKWEVPEASIWMPGILAADGLPFVLSSYCVRADGYAAFVFDPWRQEAERAHDATSEIRLRHSTEHAEKPDASLSRCGLPLGPSL